MKLYAFLKPSRIATYPPTIQQLNMKEIEVERASTDAQQTRERNALIMQMERMNLEDVRNKMQSQMDGNSGNQARW